MPSLLSSSHHGARPGTVSMKAMKAPGTGGPADRSSVGTRGYSCIRGSRYAALGDSFTENFETTSGSVLLVGATRGS